MTTLYQAIVDFQAHWDFMFDSVTVGIFCDEGVAQAAADKWMKDAAAAGAEKAGPAYVLPVTLNQADEFDPDDWDLLGPLAVGDQVLVDNDEGGWIGTVESIDIKEDEKAVYGVADQDGDVWDFYRKELNKLDEADDE